MSYRREAGREKRMKNFDKEQVLNTLSKEQRDFLANQVRRERKTLFANELAKWKVSSIDDERIEEIANIWEFID